MRQKNSEVRREVDAEEQARCEAEGSRVQGELDSGERFELEVQEKKHELKERGWLCTKSEDLSYAHRAMHILKVRHIIYGHDHGRQRSALDHNNIKRKHHKERSKVIHDSNNKRRKLQHLCPHSIGSELKDISPIENTVTLHVTQSAGQVHNNPILIPDDLGYISDNSVLGSPRANYATKSVKQTIK